MTWVIMRGAARCTQWDLLYGLVSNSMTPLIYIIMTFIFMCYWYTASKSWAWHAGNFRFISIVGNWNASAFSTNLEHENLKTDTDIHRRVPESSIWMSSFHATKKKKKNQLVGLSNNFLVNDLRITLALTQPVNSLKFE